MTTIEERREVARRLRETGEELGSGALRKLPKRAVDDACEIVSEKAVERGDML